MKVGKIATFNGRTLLAFGWFSVLVGFSSPVGLVTGVALLAVGWNELRGRKRLVALDPEGPRILGWNQLVLMGVISAYCLLGLWRTLTAPDPQLAEIEELLGIDPGTPPWIVELQRDLAGRPGSG